MFTFKKFTIHQDRCAMKVGTDGVLIGAWAKGGQRILDIGTGTGVVALMMAQRFPQALIKALELDVAAAQQAQENAAASPFAARIEVIQGALQQYSAPPFDAIVSNPPFFTHAVAAKGAARAMARQTDTLPFRDLCQYGRRLLADGGVMSMIIPADRCGEMEAEAAVAGMFLQRRIWVRTSANKAPKRCLLALGTHSVKDFEQTTCTLMQDGLATPWYQGLVADFYL